MCACVCVDARERGVYRKKERMRAGASERVSGYVCERERKGDKASERERENGHTRTHKMYASMRIIKQGAVYYNQNRKSTSQRGLPFCVQGSAYTSS